MTGKQKVIAPRQKNIIGEYVPGSHVGGVKQ